MVIFDWLTLAGILMLAASAVYIIISRKK